MSQSMGPQEGIGSVPLGPEPQPQQQMGVQTPMGFTPAQPQAEPFNPIVGLAGGTNPEIDQYLADYIAMRKNPALSNVGYNAGDYWTALGMLGAGIAQGKTLSEGLSIGTQLSSPYLQQARKNQTAEQAAALEYAMTADQAAKKLKSDQELAKQKADLDRELADKAAKARTDAATIAAGKETELEKNANLFVSTYNLDPKTPEGLRMKNFYIQYGQTGMADARALASKRAPDALPGSPEYADALGQAILDIKEAGSTSITTNYSPGEKGIPEFFKDQRSEFKDQLTKIESASQRKQKLELLSQILKLDPSKGGAVFGPGAEGRIMLEEAAKLAGINTGEYTPLLNGGEYLRLADMIIKSMTVDANADINRATNLSLTLLGQAQANIGSSTEANLLWTEVNKRSVDWILTNQQYLNDLDNYYGALNPRDLQRLDPNRPEVKGVEFVNKPITDITKDDLYTKEGKPRLSYNQYVAWRRLNDPAVPPEMLGQLKNLAQGKSVDLSNISLPNISTGSVTAPITEMDVWNTPGADPNVAAPALTPNTPATVQQQELDNYLNQDHGVPMLLIEDPATGEKRYYEKKVLPNGKVQYQLKR